jgi:hypothetical protein
MKYQETKEQSYFSSKLTDSDETNMNFPISHCFLFLFQIIKIFFPFSQAQQLKSYLFFFISESISFKKKN